MKIVEKYIEADEYSAPEGAGIAAKKLNKSAPDGTEYRVDYVAGLYYVSVKENGTYTGWVSTK